MRKRDAAGLAAIVAGGGIMMVLFIGAIIALNIAIYAGLAMLLCNWVLPMFDVDYPITFMQGCGIGVGLTIVRAMLGGVFSVKVNQ